MERQIDETRFGARRRAFIAIAFFVALAVGLFVWNPDTLHL